MLFSIITVNYNNRDGLKKTIESVIAQKYSQKEFIIIDGGSTDGSVDLINEYAQNIDYWVSEPDSGVYHAMNKGIHAAHGEWINFMNSGDCFIDNEVINSIANCKYNCDIIVGKDYHYDKKTKQGFASILPQRISGITFYIETLPHQSAFFKKELFNDLQYDESMHICADWAFYFQKVLIEGCSIKTIDQIICQREEGGMSTTHTALLKRERDNYLAKMLPKGVMEDYATIAKLDRATAYKFFLLCDNNKTRKFLRLFIKILYKLSLQQGSS